MWMRALVLCLALPLSLGACSGGDGIDVTATFDDVSDLAEMAPVMMADIEVGEVTDIRLQGTRALVSMKLDPEAEVPEDVTMRVRRTSVLGERFIDIALPDDLSPTAPLLADGTHIENTEVRSDLEDLVDEGSDVLGALSASQLAIMINEGGEGFGGRGPELGNLLANYQKIVGAYSDRSDMIVSLIRNMRSFNDTVAAEADSHARAIANTARSVRVLAEESERLGLAIEKLNRLAQGARSLMTAHLDEMKRFWSQSRTILGVLESEQAALRQLLRWAPGHNYNTQAVEYTEFNQVVQDFVICGLNDNPDDPARTCQADER